MNYDALPQPALLNFRLRNVRDAQVVAELAARGQLTVAHRYLRKSEQSVVGPGQVWAIPTQQGKRWTDGLRGANAPSSTKRGGFLCYPVPYPPAFLGAIPHAPWIKKRATLKVGEREWEIVAYDYDAQTVHGLGFRDLSGDIDDLLLPAPMQTSTLNDAEDRAPSLTPFSPPASLIPASPSPSPDDHDRLPSSSLPSPQTPPPVLWASPSDSPLLQKQERQPIPRARRGTPHLPTRLAESTRWRPYARRRDPYDDKMLARLDSCPWPARHHLYHENSL